MIPCTFGSSFACCNACSTWIGSSIVRISYRIPSARQALPVHSAYCFAAGSLLANNPTSSGASTKPYIKISLMSYRFISNHTVNFTRDKSWQIFTWTTYTSYDLPIPCDCNVRTRWRISLRNGSAIKAASTLMPQLGFASIILTIQFTMYVPVEVMVLVLPTVGVLLNVANCKLPLLVFGREKDSAQNEWIRSWIDTS